MAKSFFPLKENGPIVVPVTGSRMTLINAGTLPIFLVDDDTETALSVLEDSSKRAVLKALHSIEPGKALKLQAGTYSLDLGESFQSSAVLMVEVSEPKKAPAQTTPPANTGNPPAQTDNSQPGNTSNPPAQTDNSQSGTTSNPPAQTDNSQAAN